MKKYDCKPCKDKFVWASGQHSNTVHTGTFEAWKCSAVN